MVALDAVQRRAEPAELEVFLEAVERRRIELASASTAKDRSRLGQFFTPNASAAFLAEMPSCPDGGWRLLDPGAGVGSLSAALIARWLTETDEPTMDVTVYELDDRLIAALGDTLSEARDLAASFGRRLTSSLHNADFVVDPPSANSANVVIMNPPYLKLNTDSPERRAVESLANGLRVTNMYAAFLVCAVRALEAAGTLVAITPRSFANGPYFRDLRDDLLTRARFERIHVFDARDKVFADSDVLQENLIFSMRVGSTHGDVILSSSSDAHSEISRSSRTHAQIVHPSDSERFIRLPLGEDALDSSQRMLALPSTLADLDVQVSTGRVVDFRAREFLRPSPDERTAPLVYPQNMKAGGIAWPLLGKKPQALVLSDRTWPLFLPNEQYVLVKRFSAKEEPRRVVAAVSRPEDYGGESVVAFENHLNVFHRAGAGLDPELAAGLAEYLNSRLVDDYVRQFNGHTQINATDLRRLRYPSDTELRRLGGEALEPA